MFGTHGPYVISATLRLDKLMTAEILRDASTITSQSKSEGTATTSTAGQIGRGIVGGVIAGPVGAIIGGSGASQKIETNSTTHQTRNVDIYLSLVFRGGESAVIEVFDEASFRLLIASAGQNEWSDAQIQEAKQEAADYSKWEAEQHAQARTKQKQTNLLIAKVVGVLIALWVVAKLIGFGVSTYETYSIDRLISSGKLDEALQRVKPESAKYKEIIDLKTQAAAKACNEKSMDEIRKLTFTPKDSTAEFYRNCNTVVGAQGPFVENRKALLLERLGTGALKMEFDFIGFVNENFPDAEASYIEAIRVPIGSEWYRLSVAPTVLDGITYYSLTSLQPTNRYPLVKGDTSPSVGSATSPTGPIKCENVAIVLYANRDQLPAGETIASMLEMARSQGKCY
jgi:uncharacterized membrane protein YeaQ/YmgE (transglycosylase-associated protein family)